MEIFKGRFGNFYLYKIWAFTIVVGAILYMFQDPTPHFSKSDSDIYFFGFILLIVAIYGIVLGIPSLLISEVFYQYMGESKLSNQQVFILTLLISLITTNLTYFLFFESFMGNRNLFSISYSICLITGFFIFKQTPKTLNFKP